MTEDTQRTIGEHTGRLAALERDITEIKDDVKSIREIQESTNKKLDEFRIGWKAALLIISAAGTLGALSMKLFGLLGFTVVPR